MRLEDEPGYSPFSHAELILDELAERHQLKMPRAVVARLCQRLVELVDCSSSNSNNEVLSELATAAAAGGLASAQSAEQQLASLTPPQRQRLAALLNRAGVTLDECGRHSQGVALMRTALSLRQQDHNSDSDNIKTSAALAESLSNLGVALDEEESRAAATAASSESNNNNSSSSDSLPESVALQQQALEIRRRIHRAAPTDAALSDALATSLYNVGRALCISVEGREQEGIALLREALSLRRQQQKDAAAAAAAAAVATTATTTDLTAIERAARHADEALGVCLGTLACALGESSTAFAAADESAALHLESLALLRRRFDNQDSRALVAALTNIGITFIRNSSSSSSSSNEQQAQQQQQQQRQSSSRVEEGLKLMREAIDMERRIVKKAGSSPPDLVNLAQSLCNVAMVLERQLSSSSTVSSAATATITKTTTTSSLFEEIAALHAEALVARRNAFAGRDHPDVLWSTGKCAQLMHRAGRREEFEELQGQAKAMFERLKAAGKI
jgi:hypothetical protein